MLLVAILAIATVARIVGLGTQELWIDECSSVVFCADPDGIFHALRNDTNAPLYFILLKGWISLFGIQPAALRSLSVLTGVLQLAVVAVWIVELGLPCRVSLWAVLIGGMVPLQIHYAQEARAYPLAWLLIAISLWTLTCAVRRHSMFAMALHGIALAAALYTHNLVLGFVPAIWAAFIFLQPRRRETVAIVATHAAVAAVYLPWFIRLQAQSKVTGGIDWILGLWQSNPWFLKIPQSIVRLACGGIIPTHLLQPQLSELLQIIMYSWFFAILAGLLALLIRRTFAVNTYGSRRPVLILSILSMAPLLFMLVYSMLIRPIYVVGRYDTLVYPPLLCLLAVGTDAVCLRLTHCNSRWCILLPILLWIMPGLYMVRLHAMDAAKTTHNQQIRITILARCARPADLIVCLDHQGCVLAYQKLKRSIPAPWVTFPKSTKDHLGWIEFKPQAKLPHVEAEEMLSRFDRGQSSRIWLLSYPLKLKPESNPQNPTVYYIYEQILRQSLAEHHFKPDGSCEFDTSAMRALGLEVFVRTNE